MVGNPVLTAFVARFLLKHSKETSCLRRTKAGRVQNGTREELAWYYEKGGVHRKVSFSFSLSSETPWAISGFPFPQNLDIQSGPG